jgi:hypothetical protein
MVGKIVIKIGPTGVQQSLLLPMRQIRIRSKIFVARTAKFEKACRDADVPVVLVHIAHVRTHIPQIQQLHLQTQYGIHCKRCAWRLA